LKKKTAQAIEEMRRDHLKRQTEKFSKEKNEKTRVKEGMQSALAKFVEAEKKDKKQKEKT